MTATVGIDPRLKARRIAVRRDIGLRRLRRLQAVVAVIVAFGISFAITRSPAMDIDRLDVTAAGVDGVLLDGVLGDLTGSPLVGVDTQQVADALADLPQVETARVRRSWPGTLVVEVVGSVPGVAVATADGGWLVVDRTGRIVAEEAEVPAGLTPVDDVLVEGSIGDRLPATHRAATVVGAALPDSLRERVAGLSLEASGVVTARLVDGGSIVFRGSVDPDAAARSAAAVAATVPPGCVEQIDVRSASAPVLRRSPAC